jgi:hypothetical protein
MDEVLFHRQDGVDDRESLPATARSRIISRHKHFDYPILRSRIFHGQKMPKLASNRQNDF